MSIVEASISVPAEHETNVFGQFDQHIKKMERALNITVVNRDGVLKIIGGGFRQDRSRKQSSFCGLHQHTASVQASLV